MGKLIKAKYEIDSYPTRCKDCPAFTLYPYQCHNERGMEADCMLGYMHHHDMRDFSGNDRFKFCGIEKDPDVSIIDGERRESDEAC